MVITDSHLSLVNLTFTGNEAYYYGGGIYSNDSDPSVVNSSFVGNYGGFGGGIANLNSNLTVTGTTFSKNRAGFGGGMANLHSSDRKINVVNTTFSENSGVIAGGGMVNQNSHPSVINTVFSGNDGSEDGGGMVNLNSHTELINVIFSGNLASTGGGLANQNSNPRVINTTFTGNASDHGGGGIYNINSNPQIVNTILWHNSAISQTTLLTASILNENGSTPTFTHSLVQNSGGSGGGWASSLGTDGGGNSDNDPLFVTPISPVTAPTTAGNFRLTLSSPAINTGNSLSYTAATTTTNDLDNKPRISGHTIDKGAYEFQFNCPDSNRLYVDVDATGNGNGRNWQNAYPTINNVTQYAAGCSTPIEIWVADGVYTPGNTITDTIQMANNVSLYGGFVGTETMRSQRNWHTNVTVLSGDIGRDDHVDAGGVVTRATHITGNNSIHVVSAVGVSNTAKLDGFTITAGQADQGQNDADSYTRRRDNHFWQPSQLSQYHLFRELCRS